ncbi:MAG: alpha-L-fucosidase, partial [Muribaculaceae bacterium]|nr:alpha-L-fucosidase [Muribaculaceae bacterium]
FPGEDIQIFEQDVPGENTAGYSGENGISQLPLETCMTMNRTWGYRITDKNYKSADDIIRTLVKAAGRNGNLLINVGPRPDGCLPTEAVERLHALGEWMRQHGESIYGTRGGIIPPHDWGVTTQRGNTLYLHILNLNDDALFVPLDTKRIRQVRLFDGKSNLRYTASATGTTITLPSVPKAVDTIVEITLKN